MVCMWADAYTALSAHADSGHATVAATAAARGAGRGEEARRGAAPAAPRAAALGAPPAGVLLRIGACGCDAVVDGGAWACA
mgnify:CR=1 FL=1